MRIRENNMDRAKTTPVLVRILEIIKASLVELLVFIFPLRRKWVILGDFPPSCCAKIWPK
jgi:hypothetical protein